MQFLSTAYEALKPRLDDDLVDRLNYYYTPCLLLIFGILVSASQWVGDPIECWVPAQFNRAWEEYTENYCFVRSTYYVSLLSPIPTQLQLRDEMRLSYYQWVPFILGLMTLCFSAPYLVWWILNSQTGLDIDGLIGEAMGNSGGSKKEIEHARFLALYLREILRNQRELRATSIPGSAIMRQLFRKGIFVTGVDLFAKLLYIANTMGQLLFLNKSFGTGNSTGWGFDIFMQLFERNEWEKSGNFPRVTFCDFDVRVLGNLHRSACVFLLRYSVQCVLIINMFNEKVFLFLWCWCFILMILNLCNFFYWLSLSMNPEERLKYTRKFLGGHISEDEEDEKLHRRFTFRFLKPDGVLVLRKLTIHAGNIVGSKVLRCLFDDFRITVANRKISIPTIGFYDEETREMSEGSDDGFREELVSL